MRLNKVILFILLFCNLTFAMPKTLKISTVLGLSIAGALRFPELKSAFIAGGLSFTCSELFNKKLKKSLNKYLWTTYLIGEVIDVAQTRYILHHPERYYEVNPLIKKDRDIYISAFISTSLIYLVTKLFPEDKQHILIGANAFKWGLVIHNKRIGIWFSKSF